LGVVGALPPPPPPPPPTPKTQTDEKKITWRIKILYY
jgi:hypothetical protein